MFWRRLQPSTDAGYVATMQTVRQVKTVFVIFAAFVCCWSPYIVVLLYDVTDSLSLPVHLFTSTLAHLHASLNFAIYGLMNPDLRAGCAAWCRRLANDTAYFDRDDRSTANRLAAEACGRVIYVNKSSAAVEYHQLTGTGVSE